MKKPSLVFASWVLLAAAGWSQTVAVAASANLATLEAPLKAAFAAAYPGLSLQFTFGSSGTLVTQISQGAPFQAFLSADRGFAQKLVDSGAASGPVKTYAVGKLIFLTTKTLDLGKGLAVVADPALVQIANANPDTAPYGLAAVEALTKAGLYKSVKGKIVTAQSIAQAVQFTLTATGFGFVNKSALFSKDVAPFNVEGKFWFEVDPSLYASLEQGYVVVKSAKNLPEVKSFVAFLASKAARAVFEGFGYGVP